MCIKNIRPMSSYWTRNSRKCYHIVFALERQRFRYVGIVYMHIEKKSDEWIKFEMLFSTRNRRVKLFKMGMRTSAHVDVEGTGKTLIFIATDKGQIFHYMEDHWHPDASQGAPTCIYEWQN